MAEMRRTIGRLQNELSQARLNPFVVEMSPREFALEAVQIALRHIGEDPGRAGLLETPRRWIDAMTEMTSGHEVDIAKLLRVSFDSGQYDENIVVTDIDYTSLCEHHLLPFTGKAAVAYLPSQEMDEAGAPGSYRVVGLSKIPRVVDAFARRLQMQEQLTDQIARAIEEHVKPRGVCVVLEGSHSCASCRGVRKQGMNMVTSVMRGVYRDNPAARAEVLHLIDRRSR
jgi:GTP cyclohydrolase I